MKGYTLQQNHCTSSSCSHSLSSSTIQCPHPVQLQWSLLKPYKGLITCNTMGQYHGLQQTMCPNHVLDLNHLWLNPELRLTLTIPPLNLTWSNHQLPSKFYRGISHTPPYHLGLSPDITSELPWVCMPYQVLQRYTHLHAKCFITKKISYVFMVTIPSPSVTSSSRFLARPSILCHCFSYAMPHIFTILIFIHHSIDPLIWKP